MSWIKKAPVKFYSYIKCAEADTNYARRMQRLRNSIFGDVVRPTTSTSMRVVKLFSKRPVEQCAHFTDAYYPDHNVMWRLMHILRNYGLYRDEHRDWKDEMERLRVLRGKGRKRRGQENTNEQKTT